MQQSSRDFGAEDLLHYSHQAVKACWINNRGELE